MSSTASGNAIARLVARSLKDAPLLQVNFLVVALLSFFSFVFQTPWPVLIGTPIAQLLFLIALPLTPAGRRRVERKQKEALRAEAEAKWQKLLAAMGPDHRARFEELERTRVPLAAHDRQRWAEPPELLTELLEAYVRLAVAHDEGVRALKRLNTTDDASTDMMDSEADGSIRCSPDRSSAFWQQRCAQRRDNETRLRKMRQQLETIEAAIFLVGEQGAIADDGEIDASVRDLFGRVECVGAALHELQDANRDDVAALLATSSHVETKA